MLEIFNNKTSFLKLRPKRLGFIIFVFLVIVVFLILFMVKKDVYDNYQTKGYVTCDDKCIVVSVIPSNISYEMIYLNKKKIDYEIISKELKVDEDEFVSYYEISFSTPEKLNDKEIVELNFYYNKQRIIQKIKTKMF